MFQYAHAIYIVTKYTAWTKIKNDKQSVSLFAILKSTNETNKKTKHPMVICRIVFTLIMFRNKVAILYNFLSIYAA